MSFQHERQSRTEGFRRRLRKFRSGSLPRIGRRDSDTSSPPRPLASNSSEPHPVAPAEQQAKENDNIRSGVNLQENIPAVQSVPHASPRKQSHSNDGLLDDGLLSKAMATLEVLKDRRQSPQDQNEQPTAPRDESPADVKCFRQSSDASPYASLPQTRVRVPNVAAQPVRSTSDKCPSPPRLTRVPSTPADRQQIQGGFLNSLGDFVRGITQMDAEGAEDSYLVDCTIRRERERGQPHVSAGSAGKPPLPPGGIRRAVRVAEHPQPYRRIPAPLSDAGSLTGVVSSLLSDTRRWLMGGAEVLLSNGSSRNGHTASAPPRVVSQSIPSLVSEGLRAIVAQGRHASGSPRGEMATTADENSYWSGQPLKTSRSVPSCSPRRPYRRHDGGVKRFEPPGDLPDPTAFLPDVARSPRRRPPIGRRDGEPSSSGLVRFVEDNLASCLSFKDDDCTGRGGLSRWLLENAPNDDRSTRMPLRAPEGGRHPAVEGPVRMGSAPPTAVSHVEQRPLQSLPPPAGPAVLPDDDADGRLQTIQPGKSTTREQTFRHVSRSHLDVSILSARCLTGKIIEVQLHLGDFQVTSPHFQTRNVLLPLRGSMCHLGKPAGSSAFSDSVLSIYLKTLCPPAPQGGRSSGAQLPIQTYRVDIPLEAVEEAKALPSPQSEAVPVLVAAARGGTVFINSPNARLVAAGGADTPSAATSETNSSMQREDLTNAPNMPAEVSIDTIYEREIMTPMQLHQMLQVSAKSAGTPCIEVALTARISGLHTVTAPDDIRTTVYVGANSDSVDIALAGVFQRQPQMLQYVTQLERVGKTPPGGGRSASRGGVYNLNGIRCLIFQRPGNAGVEEPLFVREGGATQELDLYLTGADEQILWDSTSPIVQDERQNSTGAVLPDAGDFGSESLGPPQIQLLDDLASAPWDHTPPWECLIDRRKAMELACHRAAIREAIRLKIRGVTVVPPQFGEWLRPPMLRCSADDVEPTPVTYFWTQPDFGDMALTPFTPELAPFIIEQHRRWGIIKEEPAQRRQGECPSSRESRGEWGHKQMGVDRPPPAALRMNALQGTTASLPVIAGHQAADSRWTAAVTDTAAGPENFFPESAALSSVPSNRPGQSSIGPRRPPNPSQISHPPEIESYQFAQEVPHAFRSDMSTQFPIQLPYSQPLPVQPAVCENREVPPHARQYPQPDPVILMPVEGVSCSPSPEAGEAGGGIPLPVGYQYAGTVLVPMTDMLERIHGPPAVVATPADGCPDVYRIETAPDITTTELAGVEEPLVYCRQQVEAPIERPSHWVPYDRGVSRDDLLKDDRQEIHAKKEAPCAAQLLQQSTDSARHLPESLWTLSDPQCVKKEERTVSLFEEERSPLSRSDSHHLIEDTSDARPVIPAVPPLDLNRLMEIRRMEAAGSSEQAPAAPEDEPCYDSRLHTGRSISDKLSSSRLSRDTPITSPPRAPRGTAAQRMEPNSRWSPTESTIGILAAVNIADRHHRERQGALELSLESRQQETHQAVDNGTRADGPSVDNTHFVDGAFDFAPPPPAVHEDKEVSVKETVDDRDKEAPRKSWWRQLLYAPPDKDGTAADEQDTQDLAAAIPAETITGQPLPFYPPSAPGAAQWQRMSPTPWMDGTGMAPAMSQMMFAPRVTPHFSPVPMGLGSLPSAAGGGVPPPGCAFPVPPYLPPPTNRWMPSSPPFVCNSPPVPQLFSPPFSAGPYRPPIPPHPSMWHPTLRSPADPLQSLELKHMDQIPETAITMGQDFAVDYTENNVHEVAKHHQEDEACREAQSATTASAGSLPNLPPGAAVPQTPVPVGTVSGVPVMSPWKIAPHGAPPPLTFPPPPVLPGIGSQMAQPINIRPPRPMAMIQRPNIHPFMRRQRVRSQQRTG